MGCDIIFLRVKTPELKQATNNYSNKQSKFMKMHNDVTKVKLKNIKGSM